MTLITTTCWTVFAVLGYLLGQRKGRAGFGLLLGILLGPIGLLILLCFPASKS